MDSLPRNHLGSPYPLPTNPSIYPCIHLPTGPSSTPSLNHPSTHNPPTCPPSQPGSQQPSFINCSSNVYHPSTHHPPTHPSIHPLIHPSTHSSIHQFIEQILNFHCGPGPVQVLGNWEQADLTSPCPPELPWGGGEGFSMVNPCVTKKSHRW